MPYTKKIWCAYPVHSTSTRLGRNPSHSERRMTINTIQADFINNEISSNVAWLWKTLVAGDQLFKQCFTFLSISSDDSFDSQEMDIDDDGRISISDDPENLVDPPSSEVRLFIQQKARKDLNAVFHLLKMEKIPDE